MLRNWEVKLVLDRSGKAPFGTQIVRALIDDIRAGRIEPGAALPGSRVLASRLGVSRKTIVQAFDELASQGWVVTEPQRGTFAAASLPRPDADAAPGLAASLSRTSAVRLRPSLTEFMPEAAVPGAIVVDDGLPDARLLPTAIIARAYARAMNAGGRANDLGYGDPRGDRMLREAIASMLTLERGIASTADNICLTRGSQMAINLALRVFAGPGDTVALERLSYGAVREMTRAAGAQAAVVELDHDGIDLGSLEALCRRQRVRVVYATPHHQYPTTVPMRPERRMRLLAFAAQFGFVIIEDDYDHEFHFEGRPLLPLIGADHDGRVVYVGSFSKLLSPSLRLGYAAGPLDVIDRLAREVMVLDRQGDPVMERAVAALMRDGAVRRHARRVLRTYAERRLHAARLLRERCASYLDLNLPAGGLAFWLRLHPALDPVRLRDAARRRGLALLPGPQFADDGGDVRGLRLGFASLQEAEFAELVGRLDSSARACLEVG